MNEWVVIEKIRGVPKTYETFTVVVNPNTADGGIPDFVMVLFLCILFVVTIKLSRRFVCLKNYMTNWKKKQRRKS